MTGIVVAGIFARGGSKGVPRKNLRPLGGRSLLERAIVTAQSARGVDRVFVSTDDEEIAAAALRYGAEVPFRRPSELASDSAPEWLAWRHALEMLTSGPQDTSIDAMVVVPTTAPLRLPEDVSNCLEKLLVSGSDMVITVTMAQRNPYFNMVHLEPDGRVGLVIPGSAVTSRQAAPPVYDMTTVAYAVRPGFVREHDSWLDGHVEAVIVPPERALDIDTELDLRVAECLLAARS